MHVDELIADSEEKQEGFGPFFPTSKVLAEVGLEIHKFFYLSIDFGLDFASYNANTYLFVKMRMAIGLPDLFLRLHRFQKYGLPGRVIGLRFHVLERPLSIFAMLLVELRSVSFL